jgi:DNA polymerase III alpha subunit (gram-positive type)
MLDNLTIIDFETTGLPEHGPQRAIEVAAVKVLKGEIVSQFQTIIRQDIPVSEKITELTGITQQDVDKGMSEKTAFAVVNNMSAGTTLVAHNMLFDWQFYDDALQRLGGRRLTADLLCSMTLTRQFLGGKGHKLTQLMDRLGLAHSGAHRALADVHMTLQLLRVLDAQYDIYQYVNQLSYVAYFGKPRAYPLNCRLIPYQPVK